MLNNVSLIGRLVKDIAVTDIKDSLKGSFTLACNREYKDGDGNYPTDFIDCVTWNASADYLHNYAHTGDMITVTGRLQKDTWKDAEGAYHSKTYITCDRVAIVYTGNRTKADEPDKKPNRKKWSR